MDLTPEEERIHRAYRLGLSDGRGDYPGGRSLNEVKAISGDEDWLLAVIEDREQKLERQLREEREALARLRTKKAGQLGGE